MRGMLATRFPDRCFEVVNLAPGGYDSYQDYERVRVDGTRLKPDLVVIHSGIKLRAKRSVSSPVACPRN